jgi:hypothetical protein
MTHSHDDATVPGPLELLESARSKYNLALARLRHSPVELALLSLHGSLEDALRAHAMRLGLEGALAPLPQLLDALVAAPHMPLSVVEAEGVRRMHRLRAHVAHGEQLAVAEATIVAYHQFVARLLPRYGVIVAPPEEATDDEGDARVGAPATATTTRVRREALPEAHPRSESGRYRRAPAGATLDDPDELGEARPRSESERYSRGPVPRRERTVYPDDQPARYNLTRTGMPSAATRDLPLAREMLRGQQRRRGDGSIERVERLADFWARAQTWLLPVIIVISMLMIGAVISLSLQQMRATPALPTASIGVTPGSASSTEAPSGAATGALEATVTLTAQPEATVPPATGLAVGRTAYVRQGGQPLNLRERPSVALDSQVQASLEPGTAVEVIGGPVTADGYEWWQVRAGGVEGWCAGEFLELR